MYDGSDSKRRIEAILNKHNASYEVRNLVAVLQAQLNQAENDKIIQTKVIKQLKEKIDDMHVRPEQAIVRGMIPEDFY